MDIELRDIGTADLEELQALIESDPAYVERVTGHPPGAADAQSLLTMRPPGLPEGDKRVLGAWVEGHLVAVLDVLRGYPDDGIAFVGLLQVHGDRQGEGIGSRVHDLALEEIRRWAPRTTTARAAIVAANAAYAEPFWRARGYEPVGAPKPYTYDKLETTVRLWERPLTRRP